MLTIWRDIEIGRSVVVELTRFRLRWDVVEVFASNIRGARHTTANNSRSIRHSFIHSDTLCRRIHRTQSYSIGRSCHQFHSLSMSFNSRQRHYHQPRNYRHKVFWRHFFVLHRRRQHKDYLLPWRFSMNCLRCAISRCLRATEVVPLPERSTAWRLATPA